MPKGNPGKSHYRWGSGIGMHKNGYIKIRVGRGHVEADRNGWAYLHRVIWIASGNRLPNGYIIHHVNGDRLDNRIENLEMLSRAEHNRLHNKEKEIDAVSGRFIGKKAAGAMLDGREWREVPK